MAEMGNSSCNLLRFIGMGRKGGRGGVCSSPKEKAGPGYSGGAKAFQLSMAHPPQFNCARRGVNYLQTTCGGADARYSLAGGLCFPRSPNTRDRGHLAGAESELRSGVAVAFRHHFQMSCNRAQLHSRQKNSSQEARSVRARLQSCRKPALRERALAPAVCCLRGKTRDGTASEQSHRGY